MASAGSRYALCSAHILHYITIDSHSYASVKNLITDQLERVISQLSHLKNIGVDTETTGLDPFQSRMRLTTLGVKIDDEIYSTFLSQFVYYANPFPIAEFDAARLCSEYFLCSRT
jgi:hypothetical protein